MVKQILNLLGILQTASVSIDEEVVLSGDIFRPGNSALHGDVTAIDREIACVDCHRIVAVGSIVGGQYVIVGPHRLIRIGAAVTDGAKVAGIQQAFHRTGEGRVIFSISLAGIIDGDRYRLRCDRQDTLILRLIAVLVTVRNRVVESVVHVTLRHLSD